MTIGVIAIGVAIGISSLSIVRAEITPDRSRTFSCSSGTARVEGNSTGSKTWGVYGVTTESTAVNGTSSATNGNSGVAGISTGPSGNGHGVYGRSSNGYGVVGYSTAGGSAGVAGIDHSTGTKSGFGVFAESADTTGYYPALDARADKKETSIFYGKNFYTQDSCLMDAHANLGCTGTISGGSSLRVQHANASGQRVLAYGSESTSATIEDFGTARMYGGVANVYFERDFASVIDRNSPYYIFLTPLGDTHGLYVSIKTPSGFQVRETEGGRSRIAFDYRIVARPLNAKNDRLPLAPTVRIPSETMQPSQ